MKPKAIPAIVAIINKNNPIKLDDVNEIIGIISIGKTTFFTR